MTSTPRLRAVTAPASPGATVDFAGCSLRRLPAFADERGVLAVTEMGVDLPFEVRRCFFLYAVPEGARRGGHSLASTAEVMIGIHGSLTVDVHDGENCWRVILDDPTIALYVPPRVWSEEHSFSADGVLMVLASREYDATEFDVTRPGGAPRG